MVRCTRKGCGQDFDEGDQNQSVCSFHPGAPVFHEGLKSWSCCSSVSKPVTSFDDFLSIPGCASGSHSTEKPIEAPKPVVAPTEPTTKNADGIEVYGSAAMDAALPPLPKAPTPKPTENLKPVSTEYVAEEDDPAVGLERGMRCKRKACSCSWEGESREDEICLYHPGAPIFHEGSKGYSCCKHRTLDFDEFLSIKGCKKGKHLFVGAKKEDKEELVECRSDHYQTPRQVIVSVFGKAADKELSKVTFEPEALHVDLILPSKKRFTKTWNLFGPITPSESSFKILGTKVEIVLAKADGRSWPSVGVVEGGNFVPQLAFSAGGGRGTVGGKEMVLDQHNKESR